MKKKKSKTIKNLKKTSSAIDQMLEGMVKNPLHLKGEIKRKLVTIRKRDDLEKQGLELLKKGIKGKKWKFNRDELHER